MGTQVKAQGQDQVQAGVQMSLFEMQDMVQGRSAHRPTREEVVRELRRGYTVGEVEIRAWMTENEAGDAWIVSFWGQVAGTGSWKFLGTTNVDPDGRNISALQGFEKHMIALEELRTMTECVNGLSLGKAKVAEEWNFLGMAAYKLDAKALRQFAGLVMVENQDAEHVWQFAPIA